MTNLSPNTLGALISLTHRAEGTFLTPRGEIVRVTTWLLDKSQEETLKLLRAVPELPAMRDYCRRLFPHHLAVTAKVLEALRDWLCEKCGLSPADVDDLPLPEVASRLKRHFLGSDLNDIFGDRFKVDLASNTITLDNTTYLDQDHTACRIVKALRDAQGKALSGRWLSETIPGCRGGQSNVARCLDRLHPSIRICVRGKTNDGYRLQLPPKPSSS
jgi:hypothetical protein